MRSQSASEATVCSTALDAAALVAAALGAGRATLPGRAACAARVRHAPWTLQSTCRRRHKRWGRVGRASSAFSASTSKAPAANQT